MNRALPSADELTYRQHQGWACVRCDASLWTAAGGISVGRALGSDGSSIEVYACQDCTRARRGGGPHAGRGSETPSPHRQ